MKLADFDASPTGNKPLALVVRHLRTALSSPATEWNQLQLDAARQACDEAEKLLDKELAPGADCEMHPKGTTEKLRRYDVAAKEINVRLAFMGWPAESFWNGGTAESPRWIADWRKEIALLNHARHETPVDEAKLERWRNDSTPWNQIPVEQRPQSSGLVYEGLLRMVPRVILPSVCDGREQDAFEDFAKKQGCNMSQHPIHWLFLNEVTAAVRTGWKGALEYVAQQTAPPQCAEALVSSSRDSLQP